VNHYSNELRLRPRGVGRFFGAAFLAFWLCGWAAGEAFALYVLVNGLRALLTGSPPTGGDEPKNIGAAVAVGGFLLIWLAFWTIGGLAAIRELLRSLWAEDCLSVQPDGLLVTSRLGPFVTRRHLPRSEIRRIYAQRPTTALMAQVGSNTVTLSDLGTPAERDAGADWLRSELRLSEALSVTGEALPEGWQEVTDFRGETALAPDLRTRRKQAYIVTVIAGAVWSGVLLLARGSLREPTQWGVTAMAGAVACWLTWQALWLFRGRKEWRIEHARLVHQRRYGAHVTELAEARALELTESSDSDGDRWYDLEALITDRPGQKPGRRRSIQRTIHDPTTPRSLGLWLAKRSAISFRDLVPDDAARDAELARVTDALANTGTFGQWLARLVKRQG